MARIDPEIVLWLNGWVGAFPLLDAFMELVVNDYLVPVASAMGLFWLWFSGRDGATRRSYQKTVLTGVVAVGMANLAVSLISDMYMRPRPFTELELHLLFYPPTDPSFPANPVAVVSAIAASVWIGHRGLGAALYGAVLLFAFARVYAGVFYPTDVLAGILIGMGAAWGSRRLSAYLEPIPTLMLRVARILCLA